MEKQVDEQKYHSVIDDPLVTVVIPAYNEEDTIEECVCSLKNQTIKLEIIVVDDGSKDQTVAICKKIGVKTFLQCHKGPGTARNQGARNAKGNLLVFVDADMVFDPDFVSKLIASIISGEVIATCHWNEMVANWDNPWARCQTWYSGYPDKRRQPTAVPSPGGVYRAVRKDFFLDSGGFSEKEGRGDDSSIARRTGILAKRVPDAICYHKNIESPRDIFAEAMWSGRNIVVRYGSFRSCISIAFIHRNPVFGILRGFSLAVDKKEPRIALYSVIYTSGYTLGILCALCSGYYLK